MKVIKTKAIAPQPLSIEGRRKDVEEIFLFTETGHFIGTTYRLTAVAQAELATKQAETPTNEVKP